MKRHTILGDVEKSLTFRLELSDGTSEKITVSAPPARIFTAPDVQRMTADLYSHVQAKYPGRRIEMVRVAHDSYNFIERETAEIAVQ